MANKTKTPTGLSITRSGNTYTFSWKIASADHKGGQILEYEVYTPSSGQGASPSISNTATSYAITVANVTFVKFKIRGKRGKNGNTTYEYSDWASCSWTSTVPGTPTLTYKNEGVNKGTFEWSCPNDTSSTAIFTAAEYQTCIERNGLSSSYPGAPLINVSAAGSMLMIENAGDIAAGNFVRWFRIRPYGPAGYGAWAETCHAYGAPLAATITAASAITEGSSTRISANWVIGYNLQFPIDQLTVQYVIAVPTDTQLNAPANGWTDAIKLSVQGNYDGVVVNVSDAVDPDECLWVRVVSEHDGLKSYSNAPLAQIGRLKAPAISASPNTTTGDVAITITEETTCSVAKTAIFYRPQDHPNQDRLIAILDNGTTTTTVNVPGIIGATRTCFGAYAFVGNVSGLSITSMVMRSDAAIDSDIPAIAPANVSVTGSPVEGSVRISWAWSWSSATEAELSWADNEYAWESTDEPSTYRVKDTFATSWIIAGLDTGKRWFFRVRLIDARGTTDEISPWSNMVAFDLKIAPERPALTLSKVVVSQGESFIARWAAVLPDGDEQKYAEVCLVTYDEDTGDPVYGDVVAHTGPEQSVEIQQDWEVDNVYNLAVRTTSTSGMQSEWSDVASLYIVEPVTINLVADPIGLGSYVETINTWIETYDNATDELIDEDSWFSEETIVNEVMESSDFEHYMAGNFEQTVNTTVGETTTVIRTDRYEREFSSRPELRSLPLLVTITGAGTTGTTTLSILRGEALHIERPNDKDFDGYDDEVIITHTQMGEAPISIQATDLIGRLDDGGKYYLVAKVADSYGNSKAVRYPFWVNWTTKSFVPEVSVEMDPYSRIAKITPIAPSGSPTATCDIYRMSADKPELIVKSATFGTTYVDPYPAFGPAGGHRLVAITANGDYTTESGLGWYDTGIDDGDILRDESMVIDVDGEQIVLPYNLELSNKWNKDFKRTSYLGGSVQGDWNPAVTRDISANTVLVRGDDLDRQLSMRDLAGYAGIAHVRTPDGSSLTVNVQIDEQQSYDSRKISYTLTIQAIDPEGFDGMTLAEWEHMHPVGE